MPPPMPDRLTARVAPIKRMPPARPEAVALQAASPTAELRRLCPGRRPAPEALVKEAVAPSALLAFTPGICGCR